MTDKMDIWDSLKKTDPKHTKPFKRAGGFSGTAIKPMFSIETLTKQFGPCGKGWGTGKPEFTTHESDGQILVFCTIELWWGTDRNTVYGVGGDKVVGKNKYGLQFDDEAYKKSFTDALTNAMKYIGVGADIHMGMYDDSKYINEMMQEFSEPKPEPKVHTKQEIKPYSGPSKADSRPVYQKLYDGILEIMRTGTYDDLITWGDQIKVGIDDIHPDWRQSLRLEFSTAKIQMEKASKNADDMTQAAIAAGFTEAETVS